jgi:hypothetical protein
VRVCKGYDCFSVEEVSHPPGHLHRRLGSRITQQQSAKPLIPPSVLSPNSTSAVWSVRALEFAPRPLPGLDEVTLFPRAMADWVGRAEEVLLGAYAEAWAAVRAQDGKFRVVDEQVARSWDEVYATLRTCCEEGDALRGGRWAQVGRWQDDDYDDCHHVSCEEVEYRLDVAMIGAIALASRCDN